jgi:hypothetical protein
MRTQSASLPPNPSLTAILLITRSRTGPKLIFHYPAVPSTSLSTSKRDPHWYGTPGTATDDSAADSDDWDSSSSSQGGESGDEGEESSRAGSGTGSRGSRVRSRRSGRERDVGDAGGGGVLDEEMVEEGDGGVEEGGRRKEDAKKKELLLLEEPEWERVLGFSAAGLSHLLSPPKVFNKRKFEVGVEQFVFLGAPMFQREDGYWKKRRRHRKKESMDAGVSPTDLGRASNGIEDKDMSGANVTQSHAYSNSHSRKESTSANSDLFAVPGFDAAYGHGLISGAPSDFGSDDRSTSTTADSTEMVMFNLVFVLNPPSLEHHLRTDEMYTWILKRFAKVLKVEQANSNYVGSEARLISGMKEKARDSKAPISTLWPSIVQASSLARAIAVTFDAIGANKIAHVDLKGLDMSFQIPQAISTPFAPTATEPQMPGLWLTTATLIDDDEADTSLSPHATLLLLEDDDTLLKEIESDEKELSGPLSIFIRNLTPTKSLLKLSQRHSMALKDVQILARHLIYWRRARAIPPLHYRDTYVVSPNADMRALALAIPAFAARFPTLPPLTKILHLLSGPPRQYRLIMPSPDHRTAYMEILAWLMRGGWVTQLRTFAWIRVSPEVKAAVAAKQNRESRHSIVIEHSPAVNGQQHTRDNSESSILSSPPGSQTQRSPDPPNYHLQPSPLLSPYRYPTSPGPPSDSGSVSSTRTAVPSLSALSPLQRPESRTLHRPSPLHINQSASPSSGSDNAPASPSTAHKNSSSGNPMVDSVNLKSEDPKDYEASLIHSPQRATNEESAWIEHIGSLVVSLFESSPTSTNQPSTPGHATNGAAAGGAATPPDLGPGPKEMWPVLLKYFDGRYALEEISARENLKKRRIREFWAKLVREGFLVTVRHW